MCHYKVTVEGNLIWLIKHDSENLSLQFADINLRIAFVLESKNEMKNLRVLCLRTQFVEFSLLIQKRNS